MRSKSDPWAVIPCRASEKPVPQLSVACEHQVQTTFAYLKLTPGERIFSLQWKYSALPRPFIYHEESVVFAVFDSFLPSFPVFLIFFWSPSMRVGSPCFYIFEIILSSHHFSFPFYPSKPSPVPVLAFCQTHCFYISIYFI